MSIRLSRGDRLTGVEFRAANQRAAVIVTRVGAEGEQRIVFAAATFHVRRGLSSQTLIPPEVCLCGSGVTEHYPAPSGTRRMVPLHQHGHAPQGRFWPWMPTLVPGRRAVTKLPAPRPSKAVDQRQPGHSWPSATAAAIDPFPLLIRSGSNQADRVVSMERVRLLLKRPVWHAGGGSSGTGSPLRVHPPPYLDHQAPRRCDPVRGRGDGALLGSETFANTGQPPHRPGLAARRRWTPGAPAHSAGSCWGGAWQRGVPSGATPKETR